eukprot:TRINITY_DN4423_c0_g1_i1.p1 TRINITY_DN4423_c0_g1~~TRINITY_DN4423_c0_g1_i1.p1  ORF type:complete len:260 (-),score=40.05 TRINITY_DN4423_c0_g1_i1:352-1059(-)
MKPSLVITFLTLLLIHQPSSCDDTINTQHQFTVNFKPAIGPLKFEAKSVFQDINFGSSAALFVQWEADGHLQDINIDVRGLNDPTVLCTNTEGLTSGVFKCCLPDRATANIPFGQWKAQEAFALNITVGVNASRKGDVRVFLNEILPIVSLKNLAPGYHTLEYVEPIVGQFDGTKELVTASDVRKATLFTNDSPFFVGLVMAPSVALNASAWSSNPATFFPICMLQGVFRLFSRK